MIVNSKHVFIASALLVSFAYGVASGHYQLFPYALLKQAREAAADLSAHWRTYAARAPTRWLTPARPVPAVDNAAARAGTQPGLTFVSSFFDGDVALRLIDANGAPFHTWRIRYLDLWTAEEQARMETTPLSNWDVAVTGALLLPDGAAIFTFGYAGLVKLDWCGRVIWKHAYPTHHSIFRAEDGTLWVPSIKHVYPAGARTPFANIVGPFIEDSVLQLDEGGRILREISVAELLMHNELESVLLANGVTATRNLTDDYTHLNKVALLASQDAPAFPQFEAGDALLSLRNLNLILVFDPDTKRIKWYQTGPWLRQHDPDLRPDGTISVFDNRTDNAGGRALGGSRIVTVNPQTRGVRVVYRGSPPAPFYTDVGGKHVYLGNGNLLISEAMAGRIFEIDADGRIVWQYVNRYDDAHVVAETHAYGRYSEENFKAAPKCARQ
jgi:hypothetical protein